MPTTKWSVARGGLVVTSLIAATWARHGYLFASWPQTALLEFSLRFRGELERDWSTSHVTPHWFFAWIISLAPVSLWEPFVLGLWLTEQACLWAGFSLLCRALGLSAADALGAGLVAILTGLASVGSATPLIGQFYPNGPAFALTVVGIAASVRAYAGRASAAAGLAVLCHPGQGGLGAVVIGPALLGRGASATLIVRYVLVTAALAAIPLGVLVANQGAGSALTPREQYEQYALVRVPHHLIYSSFPPSEYIQTIGWLCAFTVGAWTIRGETVVRSLSYSLATLGAMCFAGAIASEVGWPLALVQAQTARITPLIVVLGVATAAAALRRHAGDWTAPFLIGCASIVLVFLSGVPRYLISSLLAGALLAALGFQRLVCRWEPPALLKGTLLWGTPSQPLTSLPVVGNRMRLIFWVALTIATAALIMRHSPSSMSADTIAWREIAHESYERSEPDSLFLVPPDTGGFRYYARRSIVVDFGTYLAGASQGEWAERIIDATMDPDGLSADLPIGNNQSKRMKRMAEAYQHAVATSTRAICRYDASHVVARVPLVVPPWLDEIQRNQYYVLFRVSDEACRAP
jgi:hypothetical protein